MNETVEKLKTPRARRYVSFLCFCAILVMLAQSCSLPQAPGDLSWDTHFTLPLGIRTYGLADLAWPDSVIEDSGSGIGMYDSLNWFVPADYGELFFSAYTKFDVRLKDELAIGPFSETVVKPQGITDYAGTADLPALDHRLESGLIESSTLTLRLQNLSGHTGNVTVTLPNFTSNSGDTLVILVPNVGGTLTTTTQNLHNYYVRLDTANNPQRITLRIHDTASDNIRLEANLSQTEFIYYTGTLYNLPIPGLSSGREIDSLPQGWDAIHPTTVDGILHMKRTLGTMANVSVDLRTYRNNIEIGDTTLVANGLYLGRDTTVVRRGVVNMVDEFPDRMTADGDMTISGRVVNCSGADTIRVRAELRAPLSFTLDPTQAHGDAYVRKVDNSALKNIKPDSSYLRIRIWNHTPVGGRVYLAIASDSLRVLSTSPGTQHIVLDYNIPAPSVDAHGNVNGTTIVEDSIGLDSTTVNFFKNPPFFTRTDITLLGSNGDTLVARASDYVKVQIIAELEHHSSTKGEDN